jgi:hypothetical protein
MHDFGAVVGKIHLLGTGVFESEQGRSAGLGRIELVPWDISKDVPSPPQLGRFEEVDVGAIPLFADCRISQCGTDPLTKPAAPDESGNLNGIGLSLNCSFTRGPIASKHFSALTPNVDDRTTTRVRRSGTASSARRARDERRAGDVRQRLGTRLRPSVRFTETHRRSGSPRG